MLRVILCVSRLRREMRKRDKDGGRDQLEWLRRRGRKKNQEQHKKRNKKRMRKKKKKRKRKNRKGKHSSSIAEAKVGHNCRSSSRRRGGNIFCNFALLLSLRDWLFCLVSSYLLSLSRLV